MVVSVVIIQVVATGSSSVATLTSREEDQGMETSVTMVSIMSHAPFNREAISKNVAAGPNRDLKEVLDESYSRLSSNTRMLATILALLMVMGPEIGCHSPALVIEFFISSRCAVVIDVDTSVAELEARIRGEFQSP